MVCEERIFEVKAICNSSIPHNSKTILVQKPQTVPKKTKMYCTNYHNINHNVETCRVKKKKDFVPIVSKVITQHIKVQRHVRYSCHICGDIGYKIINFLKYNYMQNMFKE